MSSFFSVSNDLTSLQTGSSAKMQQNPSQSSYDVVTEAFSTQLAFEDCSLRDNSYTLKTINSDVEFLAEAKLLRLSVEELVLKKCGISNGILNDWQQLNFQIGVELFTDDEIEALESLEISEDTNIPILQKVRHHQINMQACSEFHAYYNKKNGPHDVLNFKEVRNLDFFKKYEKILFDTGNSLSGKLISQSLLSYIAHFEIDSFFNSFSSETLSDYINTDDGLNSILKILKKNPELFKKLPLEFQSHPEVSALALKLEISNYNFLPYTLKNRIFLSEVIFKNPEILSTSSSDLLTSWKLLYSTIQMINQQVTITKVKVDNLPNDEIKKRMLQGAEAIKLPTSINVDENTYFWFLYAVAQGDYQDDVFKQNYSDLAIKALTEDKITPRQFSTLMIYQSLLTDHAKDEIRVIPLFEEDGLPNMEVIDAICQTMKKKYGTCHITPMQLVQFFELMKKAPDSEQYFFSIPAAPKYNGSNTVIAEIGLTKVDLNVFAFYDGIEQQKLRMVPSCTMKQAFLNAVFTHDAVTILPKIGLSTEQEILDNAFDATRDEAIPVLGYVELPKTADNFHAPTPYDFNAHDTYHAIICSNIPDEHRKITGHTSKRFQEEVVDRFADTDLKQISAKLANALIDMEFTIYRITNKDEKNMHTLVESINGITKRVLNYLIHIDELYYDDEEKNPTQKFLESTIISDLAKIFIEISKETNKYRELKSFADVFKADVDTEKSTNNDSYNDILYSKVSFIANLIDLLERE